MKALLPHKRITYDPNRLYQEDFYWFMPCDKCGVLVACGLFNWVAHEEKFHNLGALADALCRQFEQKKKPVDEMSEFEAEQLIQAAFYDVEVMEEDPELEGMTIDQMFAYLKAKMK